MDNTRTQTCDLILALDVETGKEGLLLLDRIGENLNWVKIGLQLYLREGASFVKSVAERGYSVFLDLKLHDIPNTVASAIGSLADLPIDMLTLHASGGESMMQRALEAQQKHRPGLKLLAVTVLTSFDAAGLAKAGFARSPEETVLQLGQLAANTGIHGIVCSPLETRLLRQKLGPEVILVTPGIRPEGSEAGDQKRIMTPARAAEAGSSYIVVGRPILQAPDPGLAARDILQSLNSASS